MNNPVNWFEIATKDLERAKTFYATVFKRDFRLIEMPNMKMYMFDGGPENAGATGALIDADESKPSSEGTTIYFSCEDVAVEANLVADAGGTVALDKTSIGEFGYIAMFIDTEGNKIGLHSRS